MTVMIEQIPVGDYHVNTYLLSCADTGEGVIIDPAGEEKRLELRIQKAGIKLKYILNTHGHADHVVANEKLKTIFSVPVGMHEADDRFFSDDDIRKKTTKELGLPPPKPADILFKDGEFIQVGNLSIKVIHTPGHTPGSSCYLVEKNLFTGDTLFVGAVGRTDLTGGNLDTLLESLKKLIKLPSDTTIWPGHDYGDTPTSTIGREIRENPYITDFLL
ncbi:MAG: MBL fold metallo-hydrolase [Desulfobacterales bacterium]